LYLLDAPIAAVPPDAQHSPLGSTTVSHPGPTSILSSLPGRKADLSDPVATRYITLNEIDPEEVTVACDAVQEAWPSSEHLSILDSLELRNHHAWHAA
jgi:hypothetical protein